jgi:hypothetical protein
VNSTKAWTPPQTVLEVTQHSRAACAASISSGRATTAILVAIGMTVALDLKPPFALVATAPLGFTLHLRLSPPLSNPSYVLPSAYTEYWSWDILTEQRGSMRQRLGTHSSNADGHQSRPREQSKDTRPRLTGTLHTTLTSSSTSTQSCRQLTKRRPSSARFTRRSKHGATINHTVTGLRCVPGDTWCCW